MTHDDEFISVDLMKVFNILLTESSENLHSIHINIVGSLTPRAELTVALEIVQADVKLGAGGGELAGTVQTIALVVMWADLERCEEVQYVIILLQQKYMTVYSEYCRSFSAQYLLLPVPQEAEKDHSAVTAGTAVSPSNPEDQIFSKSLHCMESPDYGDFYT